MKLLKLFFTFVALSIPFRLSVALGAKVINVFLFSWIFIQKVVNIFAGLFRSKKSIEKYIEYALWGLDSQLKWCNYKTEFKQQKLILKHQYMSGIFLQIYTKIMTNWQRTTFKA